jgi:CubicO group peptidase (beta-lactamase class C family)
MKRLALAVLLAASPSVAWPQARNASELDPKLIAIADSVADRELPALAGIAILKEGKVVWERYWHGSDSATSLNVKSVSKSLLSSLVGVAVRDGLLSLDQPIATILPEYFPRSTPSSNMVYGAALATMATTRRQVTVRHLLTMSSGMIWEENGPLLQAFLSSTNPPRFVAELPLEVEPGKKFNYTTGGTHLLAKVLATATKTSNRDYAERQVFGPAGITLGGWDVDAQGLHFGGSEMFGKQIIPREWIEQSWSKQIPVETASYVSMIPQLDGYGYLWWRRTAGGHPTYCALGFGGQFVMVTPALDLVIAGGSTLDQRNPGTAAQFAGIFKLVDQILMPAVRP